MPTKKAPPPPPSSKTAKLLQEFSALGRPPAKPPAKRAPTRSKR